ncbi:MAG: AMP-binding protein [Planctomycetes bacterium]|nr:AMP-binding protein [Planctomycetota bacterium]MBI3848520.1 AMP-binding protein [Planctomycetota bacterium]
MAAGNVCRQELSPVHFVEWAGVVHAERLAVADGDVRFSWREFRDRARRFASALRAAGLRDGDRVAFLATNGEMPLLAHFGVPGARGVLVGVNIRLSAEEIGYIVEHSGAKTVFVSPELEDRLAHVPSSVRRIDTRGGFEAFLKTGSPDEPLQWPAHEDDLLSINYTSGTTGRPKGVMYRHRGAYLNALAMALNHRLTEESRYLWIVPMFHSNGWTYPWAIAAAGAASVCLPHVDPPKIWRLLDEGVTQFNSAPTVLIMLVNDPAAHRLARRVRVIVGAAPPSPSLFAKLEELNFEIVHSYGLTETYAPFVINVEPAGVDNWPANERMKRRVRQGFVHVAGGEMRVVDDAMADVPRDGHTMGEVVMRGNIVTQGYYADPEATETAFAGGWFHSGDIAVWHTDGSIELRDRKKDIIISGGENISTIEVEQAVASHPAVMECAVIAIPDEKWGERPKAFVTLKPGASASADEIIAHCRAHLAHFKAPSAVEFCALPKTSTGKIQKFILRARDRQPPSVQRGQTPDDG